MWNVAALYRFVDVQDILTLKMQTSEICARYDICGTLLLAPEGINGTIGAPSSENLEQIMNFLEEKLAISKGEVKYSHASKKPFRRMKVRLKKEIVTLRAPEANPALCVGTYVTAENWNSLITNPDITVIDTRNEYETAIGIFKGAIDPKIDTFTQFKDFVSREMNPEKHQKIAMFCTGGIRCEKASALMLKQGFGEVYHLKGGILKYLEEVPAQNSLWEGECFVFDHRVTVDHQLQKGHYELCHGCGWPVSIEEQQASRYEAGVTCPHCFASVTEEQKARFRERCKQLELAAARGEPHLGAPFSRSES